MENKIIEVPSGQAAGRTISIVIALALFAAAIVLFVVFFPLGFVALFCGIFVLVLGNQPQYEDCPECGGRRALAIEKDMWKVTCKKCAEKFEVKRI